MLMIYWSSHPICGDVPMNFKDEITDFLIHYLINDIEQEISSNRINPNINSELRNVVILFKNDHTKIAEALYQEIIYKNFEKELWNLYKYEIIQQYKNDTYSFVVPFYFILFGVRIKEEAIKDLVDMLKDGNSTERNFNSWNQIDEDHPMYYVELVKKYKLQLFDEKNSELDEEFIKNNLDIEKLFSVEN